MDKSIDQIMMAGSNLPVSLWVNSLPVDDRQIATEAVYLCVQRQAPINRMELGHAVRELRRKQRAESVTTEQSSTPSQLSKAKKWFSKLLGK